MDADGNGDATLAEFMAKAQASYEAADADKDGKIAVWSARRAASFAHTLEKYFQ